MQDIFGCASSTAPFGRTEGCSVSPRGQPLYSRHAKTPHEEQICFSPEESHGGLWTSCVCLLLLLQPPDLKEAPATMGWPEWDPRVCEAGIFGKLLHVQRVPSHPGTKLRHCRLRLLHRMAQLLRRDELLPGTTTLGLPRALGRGSFMSHGRVLVVAHSPRLQ